MMLEVLLEAYLVRRSCSSAGEAETWSVFFEEGRPTHNLSKSTSQYFLIVRFKGEQSSYQNRASSTVDTNSKTFWDWQGKSLSLHTAVFLLDACLCKGLPWWLSSQESICNTGDTSSIPGLGRSSVKEMATHSSIFAWRIPWTEEPGGLQLMGSQRVGHD